MFHSSPGSRWLSNDAPIACGVDESTPSWSTKENVSDIPYNFKQDRRYLIYFWKLFIHDCLKLLERGKKSAQISKKKKMSCELLNLNQKQDFKSQTNPFWRLLRNFERVAKESKFLFGRFEFSYNHFQIFRVFHNAKKSLPGIFQVRNNPNSCDCRENSFNQLKRVQHQSR